MRPWPVPVPSIVLAACAAGVCLGATAARAQDRYGPPEPATAPQETAQPSPSVYLYWPGKPTAPASPVSTAPTAPAPRAVAPTTIYAPATPARPAAEPLPLPPWEAAYAPSAAPQSPRDTAPPPAPQTAAGSQTGLPPRFYSVQRQYGVAATVPLSPQFLADSASTDLAAPPPAPAPPVLSGQASTTSTAAAIRQRQADEAVADDASQSPQP
jgi:hypothetical protein